MRTFTLLLAAAHVGLACYIAGTDSGRCDPQIATDPNYRLLKLPHCGKYVKYAACLPDPRSAMPPDRNFKDGRFANHTATNKDKWVGDRTWQMIKERKRWEQDEELREANKAEKNITGKTVTWRFSRTAYGGGGQDCTNALAAYMCYINFPRCDDETHQDSLMTCRSACENYFTACKYGSNSDLQRCGESDLMNGYDREKRDEVSGRYMRDFFPGQPFRDFIPAYCTPGLKDAAWRLRLSWLHVATVILALATMAGPALSASPRW